MGHFLIFPANSIKIPNGYNTLGNNPQRSFCKVYPSTLNFGLGQMTSFGQWDAGKLNAGEGLKWISEWAQGTCLLEVLPLRMRTTEVAADLKIRKTRLTWIQSQHEGGSAYSLLRALHFWHGLSHTNTGLLHDWQGCKHPTWTMSLPPLCDTYPNYEDSTKWQLRKNVPSSLRSIIHNGNCHI